MCQGDLDTLERQLDHAARMLPLARHFLTHVRAARHSRANKKSWTKLTKPVLANLVLWMELLGRVSVGISMNLIVARRPNRVCWPDVSIWAWRISLAIGLGLASVNPQRETSSAEAPCSMISSSLLARPTS